MAVIERRHKTKTSYRVMVRDKQGSFYPIRSFDSELDAKEYELKLLKDKEAGRVAFSKDSRTTDFRTYWEVWSQDSVRKASPGWRISQNQMMRDYIMPVLGDKILADIDKPLIGELIQRMEKMGRSGNTVKHVYALLHVMFKDAVEYYEMLPKNPVVARFHRPGVVRREQPFLRPQEVWNLLETARSHYLGAAVWLGALSALRISEIQALTGDKLFFDEGYILVSRAYNRKIGALQDYPKQKDWARSPMPRVLVEYLRDLNIRPGEFVVKGAGGGMMPYETFLPNLRRLCKAAGVPEISTHGLRHSATELWANQGASTEDIRRLLNHSSLNSTAHYIHRTNERLSRLGEGISNLRLIRGGNDAGLVTADVAIRQQSDVCGP